MCALFYHTMCIYTSHIYYSITVITQQLCVMKMHIGKKIKEAVKRSGMSVTEFAAKINYSRRNIYSIFEKESIDTSLLIKISTVLDQDFFVHYSTNSKKYGIQHGHVAEPPGTVEYSQNRMRELLKEIEYLKEINALLKIQIEKLSNKKVKG